MPRKPKSTSNKSIRKPSGGGQFHIEFKNEAQGLAWAAFKQHDVLFMTGPAGTGKAQPLDSDVYTTNGCVKMRDIKVGNTVLTPDGTASVIAVHPQGKKKIFRVEFVDGDSVECCEDHLWKVDNSNNDWKEPRVVSTKWIIDNFDNQNRRNLEIEIPKEVSFSKRDVKIDPYLLGVLIGDGCLVAKTPRFSSADEEIVCKIQSLLEEGYSVKKLSNKYEYSISRGFIGGKINRYTSALKEYGLWGFKSEFKFIPEDFLFNTKEIRLAVLQGLMDTDGSVDKKGYVEFSSSSRKLAYDLKFLVQSLGGLCKVVKKSTSCLPSYRCHIKIKDPSEIFLLERKKYRCNKKSKINRRIKNVELAGFKEAKCITLSDEKGLYLTNNFVVTHNSFLACAFAIEQILNKEKKKIVLTRPIVEAGESLGFLPGEFEEKVHPYMMPMYDCIDKLVGREGPWREKIDQCIEVAPIAYMRGRAERLNSPIMTPDGVKLMGEIKVGDEVIGSNGNSINVIGVFPQGKKKIYRVTFSDKTFVECSGDHLWSTMTLNEKRHNKGYSVKTTSEISNTVKNKHGQKIHRVPILSGPVQFASKKITVDPYLLGVLLGDGNIRKGAVRLSVDEEIVTECQMRLPEGITIKNRGGCDFGLVSENGKNVLLEQLYKFNLVGSKSYNKFIPEDYKYNSVNVRLELLKGIMDADGWVCKHRSGACRIQYCSTSKMLAEDVKFLVRSLGGYAYSRKLEYDEFDTHVYNGHQIKHVHDSYVVDILISENPFKLLRKARMFHPNQKAAKLISSVEYVGEHDCQCIQVDSQDHLYVTRGFTLTHNTFDDAVCIFDEAQNASLMQLKLFLTRFGEGSKVILTGDPTQSDIGGDVALSNVMHRLQPIQGVGVVQFKPAQIVRHPLVGKIIEAIEG